MRRLHRQSLLPRRIFEDVGKSRQLIRTSASGVPQLGRRRQTMELHATFGVLDDALGFLPDGQLASESREFRFSFGAA